MSQILDTEFLSEIQYGVIEAPDGGATFPSGQWTVAEVLAYLNQRQQRFVRSTRIYVGFAHFAVAGSTSRADLQAEGLEDLGQIVRVVWETAAGAMNELPSSEMFAADAYDPTWSVDEQTQPIVYNSTDVPTLTVLLIPTPSAAGTLWIHYVPTAPTLDGSGQPLSVPPEFALGLKWGVFADMLGKPGVSQDPQRAAYANARYQELEDFAQRMIQGF